MSKTSWGVIVIVVLVVLVGGYWFLNKSNQSGKTNSAQSVNQDTSTTTSTPSVSQSQTKEFIVTASNYKFDPMTMEVNQGDSVKITLKNSEGMHDLVIDELNQKTKLLRSGQEETVTFTADKSGTYKYYCSVGNHRAMGMEGTLVVK